MPTKTKLALKKPPQLKKPKKKVVIKLRDSSSAEDEEECAICLEPLQESEAVKLDCNHRYHETCLKLEQFHHLQMTTVKCPYCRATTDFSENFSDTFGDDGVETLKKMEGLWQSLGSSYGNPLSDISFSQSSIDSVKTMFGGLSEDPEVNGFFDEIINMFEVGDSLASIVTKGISNSSNIHSKFDIAALQSKILPALQGLPDLHSSQSSMLNSLANVDTNNPPSLISIFSEQLQETLTPVTAPEPTIWTPESLAALSTDTPTLITEEQMQQLLNIGTNESTAPSLSDSPDEN